MFFFRMIMFFLRMIMFFLRMIMLMLCMIMDFPIKMLCATSSQCWAYESSQGKLLSISKAPSKFTANQKVSGVMLFWNFNIVIKSNMALNSD